MLVELKKQQLPQNPEPLSSLLLRWGTWYVHSSRQEQHHDIVVVACIAIAIAIAGLQCSRA
jgi:hypothetical protein